VTQYLYMVWSVNTWGAWSAIPLACVWANIGAIPPANESIAPMTIGGNQLGTWPLHTATFEVCRSATSRRTGRLVALDSSLYLVDAFGQWGAWMECTAYP
jgi:hypothetical protein